jgi:hypothetical protein
MEANCARCRRKVKSGGRELVTCPSVGEHRGVSLGLFHRAPEGRRRGQRRRGDVERRRTRTRKQVNKYSASGLQPQARSRKGGE